MLPGYQCRAVRIAISSGSQCCSSNRPYLLTREMVSSFALHRNHNHLKKYQIINFHEFSDRDEGNSRELIYINFKSWHVMAYRSLGFRRHSPRSFWKQPVFTSPQPKTCQLLVPELIFGRCNMGQQNCMSMSNFYVHVCRVETNFCRKKQNTICPYALAVALLF